MSVIINPMAENDLAILLDESEVIKTERIAGLVVNHWRHPQNGEIVTVEGMGGMDYVGVMIGGFAEY
ncbi:hypothetical protein [Methylobacter sp.]|uniref:hypothetical protein n=1 Tax=Methylobacter sp. TaxID=2051955 RepID=UPI0012202E95|nr:hypothetical protein [Methylobacter sp.]TAK64648.1 MAG: hypothetical protein EPO18_02620 [Methylobacter sp.]